MSHLVEQEDHNKDQPPKTMLDNAYLHHLDNPILLRINADNSRPRDVICFWLIFALVIGLSIILALFVAPKEIIIKTNQTQLKNTIDHRCMNPFGFDNGVLICNSFSAQNPNLGLLLRNLNALNQFALIYLDLGIQKQEKSHEISQKVQVNLYSLILRKQNGTGRFFKGQQIGKRLIQFIDSKQNTSFRFYGESVQHLIGFYRQLKQQNYLLVIKFEDPEQIAKVKINPTLKAILVNDKFSLFVIIVRGVGLVITLLTGALYLYRYVKTNYLQRTIQQKLVLAMSFLILFFNDPTYFISVLWPSTLNSIFSVFFLTQFIVYIFFFWIIGAERIYREEGQLNSEVINRPKKIIYFLYFACYFIMLSWYYSKIAIASYSGHFIVNPQQISPGLSFIFQMWLIINITIYLMIVVQIFQKDRAKLWRSRSWLYFNTYFAFILIVFVLVNGSIYEQNSKLILIFYNSLNLYCIYMQFMFSNSMLKRQNNKMIPINELEQKQSQEIELSISNIPQILNNNSNLSDL